MAYNELQMESFGYDSMPTDHRNSSDSVDLKQQIPLRNDGKVPAYEMKDLTKSSNKYQQKKKTHLRYRSFT